MYTCTNIKIYRCYFQFINLYWKSNQNGLQIEYKKKKTAEWEFSGRRISKHSNVNYVVIIAQKMSLVECY